MKKLITAIFALLATMFSLQASDIIKGEIIHAYFYGGRLYTSGECYTSVKNFNRSSTVLFHKADGRVYVADDNSVATYREKDLKKHSINTDTVPQNAFSRIHKFQAELDTTWDWRLYEERKRRIAEHEAALAKMQLESTLKVQLLQDSTIYSAPDYNWRTQYPPFRFYGDFEYTSSPGKLTKHIDSLLYVTKDSIWAYTTRTDADGNIRDYQQIEAFSLKREETDTIRFNYWLTAIAPHLNATSVPSKESIDAFNLVQSIVRLETRIDSIEAVMHKARPNGFIKDWNWNTREFGDIEVSLTYKNSSKKRVKYVALYFKLFNPVDDALVLNYPNNTTGKIEGIGPIEPGEEGMWNFDSVYILRNLETAVRMQVVKLVITYFDGTKATVQGKQLFY